MSNRVKFGETLQALLTRANHPLTRKEICDRLGLSQAVLSQYVHGKSTPRLNTLVRLAEILSVDLHYLVFGEQLQPARTIDLGPFQYIDKSLAGLHAKNDAYFAAVSRMTSALAQQIEGVARQVVDEHQLSGGVIHDNEIFEIEQYSSETVMARLRLDFQFDSPDGKGTTLPAGRFLPLVAKNLIEGRSYTYILPKQVRNWQEPANTLREVLLQMDVPQQNLKKYCRIGVTSAPLVAGCVIYRLDMERLLRERPHLYHQVTASIVGDQREGWLGCTLPPSTRLQANPVMDSYHLEQARKMVKFIRKEDFTLI